MVYTLINKLKKKFTEVTVHLFGFGGGEIMEEQSEQEIQRFERVKTQLHTK